jgi:protein-cysteine N-palmitoyltransferase HHAT
MAQGFWKNWHASYNQWLVRYMYIPLGGSRWRALNVWPIFTFVAVWHDLDIKLLGWAWLMCFFTVPELVKITTRLATAQLCWQRYKCLPLVVGRT